MEKKPKKEKKPLTTVQKKRRYRAIQWSCFGGEFVSVLLPYIVIGAVNFDEYFVQTGPDAWKVSLGGIIAMAVMGMATYLVSRKKENKEITNGFIALIVGWFTVALVLYLLSSIINDIAMIMFCGGLGLLGALGLDMTSTKYKKKADKYKAFIEEQELRGSNMEMEASYQAQLDKKIEDKRRKAVD